MTPKKKHKTQSLGWHVISGEQILGMLYAVADGDHPDIVFAEMWANAGRELVFEKKSKKGKG